MLHLEGVAESAEERELMALSHKIEVKRRHKNAIMQDERGFFTWVGKGRAGRKQIRSKTEEGLYEKLYIHYANEDSVPTLGDAMVQYIEWRTKVYGNAQSTKDRTLATARFFDGIKDKKINKLTSDDLRIYIRGNKPYKKYEIKAAIQVLKGTYKWAVERGHVQKDPAYAIEPKEFFKDCEPDGKKAKDKIFLPEEIEAIKNELRAYLPNMRAYAALVAIETGMRAGELVALHWTDISDDEIYIHRQQSLVLKDGKRGAFEDTYVEVEYTKDTRMKDGDEPGRSFPVTPAIRAILDEVRAITGDCEYVFTEKGRWITKTSYEKWLHKHLKKLGYDAAHNHAFRMTLISNVFQNCSVTPAEEALVMGHSAEVALRHYTHARKESVDAVREKISQPRSTT